MSADPFVVHVARLRRQPGTRRHDAIVAPIDLIEELRPGSFAESAVTAGADVECEVDLESFPGGVMVSGTVAAPWSGICRRCAVDVGGHLVVGVRERFVDQIELAGVPEDDEAYPIVDDRADLAPMVRDALLLELPLAPLCSEACRGLCPTCGADRNHEECRCEAPTDPRWASLDVLRSTS
ncbi:MAG TPA: DUF177 domain-containing protein [Acidimicrobiales bacterium]|nr:DUF177 domain-containing protein [Acidimicrobiales bacterium]